MIYEASKHLEWYSSNSSLNKSAQADYVAAIKCLVELFLLIVDYTRIWILTLVPPRGGLLIIPVGSGQNRVVLVHDVCFLVALKICTYSLSPPPLGSVVLTVALSSTPINIH